MNMPKLRFPGFEKEWVNIILGNYASIIDGNYGEKYPKEEEFQKSGVPFFTAAVIGSSGIFNPDNIKYISEEKNSKLIKAQSYGGDIIITNRGANMGVVGIIPTHFKLTNIGPQLTRIRIQKDRINASFIQNYLQSYSVQKKINDANSGSAMNFISLTFMKELELLVPNLPEQIKIGHFFEVLNNKIQLQQEKIDLLKEQKKGYMQKIFSRELRFKDDNGKMYPEWQLQIKAEKLFESISNKNHNGEYPVLSATQGHGMVYRDSLDRQMSFNDDNLGSYKLIEQDDFIISLRSFQGGIEFSNLQGLVSPAYTVFRKKSELVHELYFAKLFKTEHFIMRLNSTTYGIRDGKAISYKDFSSLKFDVPCIGEQIKIANFLDTLDKKISFELQKLNQLINQKQYFMQQMFI